MGRFGLVIIEYIPFYVIPSLFCWPPGEFSGASHARVMGIGCFYYAPCLNGYCFFFNTFVILGFQKASYGSSAEYPFRVIGLESYRVSMNDEDLCMIYQNVVYGLHSDETNYSSCGDSVALCVGIAYNMGDCLSGQLVHCGLEPHSKIIEHSSRFCRAVLVFVHFRVV